MLMLEPLLSKAARQLGIDQVELRRINAPVTGIVRGTECAGNMRRS